MPREKGERSPLKDEANVVSADYSLVGKHNTIAPGVMVQP